MAEFSEMISEPINIEHKGFSDRFISTNPLKEGIHIYTQGFIYWRIWFYMATSEIRRRYRRTLIGPFWTTLSLAIFIGTMGILFPILWHTDVKTFLPFFSSGFIIWTFVSSTTTEACSTFLEVSGLIKQVPFPYSIYSNAVMTRNFLVMLHHLVIYAVIMLIFHVPMNLNTLLIIPAMLLLCFMGSWSCILLGLLTARFRDVKQVVVSLLQIAMFLTPIFWRPSQVEDTVYAKFLVTANPLFHFVAIARAPLLGEQPTLTNWLVVIGVSVFGWLMTMRVLTKYYKHVVFWL